MKSNTPLKIVATSSQQPLAEAFVKAVVLDGNTDQAEKVLERMKHRADLQLVQIPLERKD